MQKQAKPRICRECGTVFVSLTRKLSTCSATCYIKSKIEIDHNDCWLWPGEEVYGLATWDGTKYHAHRFVYETLKGPIPPNKILRHSCGVRHCTNPDHLRPIERKETAGLNVAEGLFHPRPSGRRLKAEQVLAIYNSKARTRELARQYEISEVSVVAVRTGKTWANITGHFSKGGDE